MPAPKINPIKKAVEKKLTELLKPGSKPERNEMQVLGMAIKFLAVEAKLDEGDYGSELSDLEEDEGKAGNDDEPNGIKNLTANHGRP